MKKTILLFLIATVMLLVSCTSPQKATAHMTDPFEHIHISFAGNPDKGYVSIDTSDCSENVRKNFRFHCDKDGRLSNGQTTVITALPVTDKDIPVLRYQKEYIVTGVDFYPEELEDYEKQDLNKTLFRYAGDYIEEHIKDFPMTYNSQLDRTGWSKSGAFDYTYFYHDMEMIYRFSESDKSDNIYFILYDVETDIHCTEDMDSHHSAPMKKGESDTGQSYVVVGARGIKATSDKIFRSDISVVEYQVFADKTEAENFCTHGENYHIFKEDFVMNTQ